MGANQPGKAEEQACQAVEFIRAVPHRVGAEPAVYVISEALGTGAVAVVDGRHFSSGSTHEGHSGHGHDKVSTGLPVNFSAAA